MKLNKTNNIKVTELASVLKVLAEPNRLMLLDRIIDGVTCNCELGQSLALAPNLVSHHLSKLCESGLVIAKRDQTDARWIHYRINEDVLQALREHFHQFTDPARIKAPRSICPPKLEPVLEKNSSVD